MKKKFELVKTIQLFLFFLITGIGLVIIFTDKALYQMVGSNNSVRILCVLLWLTMACSFLFIFWDFSTHNSFKKDYRELDYALYNDRLSGIANRFSCDAMIEKYADKPLPDKIGCVMINISNIREINEKFGHIKGNHVIRDFSDMLHVTSLGLCFVGRNGGNKFMALFEDSTKEQMHTFLTRVNEKIEQYNSNPANPHINYGSGSAYSGEDQVDAITSLISLADRRLASKTDSITGFGSRSSCDDILSLYTDAPIPEGFACVMAEITNIREINELGGHSEGDRAIRYVGDILRESGRGICFVGRNGGMKFLALFEKGGAAAVESFLANVTEGLKAYNEGEGHVRIELHTGSSNASSENELNVHQLVSLADRRLRESV